LNPNAGYQVMFGSKENNSVTIADPREKDPKKREENT
jgi:hypothetical protein